MEKHKLFDIWKETGDKPWKLYLPRGVQSFKFKSHALRVLAKWKNNFDLEEFKRNDYSINEFKRKCEKSECSLPPKNRLLKVGDRVAIGNLKYNKVVEVLDSGKYVKIITINPEKAYGKFVGTNARIWYRLWVDCLPYRKPEDALKIPKLEKNKDLRLSYQQRQIESLLSSYYSSNTGLDLNPDYQRGNIWTQEQKVDLINSIFNNVDIGKFAIIRRPFGEDHDKYYEVLDGKQRITALIEFYEDRFRYKGVLYSELSPYDRNHFDDFSVSYAETSPLTDEQKYRYFLNLNKSGSPVDPKHIEKVEKLLEGELKKSDRN